MQNNIIILNRSDNEATVPKIIIRSRDDKKDSKTIDLVREHLIKRHSTFEIRLTLNEARNYTETNNELPYYLINRACSFKKPFVNNDFDYLRRSVRRMSCRLVFTAIQITVNYDIEYLTSLTQEDQIDHILHTIFKENNAYDIGEMLPRIKFAYDYIIANVRYDQTFVRHSAYNALVEKTAVCEGCATLLYRMLSMFGVPCRIVTGRGLREYHAWNLIKLNGKWYNADVTWDLYKTPVERGLSLYSYFLKADSTFHGHTRDIVFATSEFSAQHPMSSTDYSPQRKFRNIFKFG